MAGRIVISPILVFSINDEFGVRTQLRHRDLGVKENIAALVESGDYKRENSTQGRELALLEERGKRRECELGGRVGTTRREGATNYK